jgi:hypothetical protein
MVKSLSLPAGAGAGDLARCVTHEADDTWPTLIEIVAYFGPKGQPRKGRRVAVEINPDEFYGRKGFNAPMSGEALIHKVDMLRRK